MVLSFAHSSDIHYRCDIASQRYGKPADSRYLSLTYMCEHCKTKNIWKFNIPNEYKKLSRENTILYLENNDIIYLFPHCNRIFPTSLFHWCEMKQRKAMNCFNVSINDYYTCPVLRFLPKMRQNLLMWLNFRNFIKNIVGKLITTAFWNIVCSILLLLKTLFLQIEGEIYMSFHMTSKDQRP